jgi:hypothetical protein
LIPKALKSCGWSKGRVINSRSAAISRSNPPMDEASITSRGTKSTPGEEEEEEEEEEAAEAAPEEIKWMRVLLVTENREGQEEAEGEGAAEAASDATCNCCSLSAISWALPSAATVARVAPTSGAVVVAVPRSSSMAATTNEYSCSNNVALTSLPTNTSREAEHEKAAESTRAETCREGQAMCREQSHEQQSSKQDNGSVMTAALPRQSACCLTENSR